MQESTVLWGPGCFNQHSALLILLSRYSWNGKTENGLSVSPRVPDTFHLSLRTMSLIWRINDLAVDLAGQVQRHLVTSPDWLASTQSPFMPCRIQEKTGSWGPWRSVSRGEPWKAWCPSTQRLGLCKWPHLDSIASRTTGRGRGETPGPKCSSWADAALLFEVCFPVTQKPKHYSCRKVKMALLDPGRKKKKPEILPLAECDGELPAGHQETQVQHLNRLIVCGHNVIFADDPAESQVELELSQPAANAHPFPKAKWKMRKRINLFLLLKPTFRSKLTWILKIIFTGPQHLGIQHQHCSFG